MNLKKWKGILRVNLLGPGPRLIKKNLPGRGLTKVEKHCLRVKGNTASLYKSGTAFSVRCELQIPLGRPRCIRRSVSCLSLRISGFDPESVHVRYVMAEVAMGQSFLRTLAIHPRQRSKLDTNCS